MTLQQLKEKVDALLATNHPTTPVKIEVDYGIRKNIYAIDVVQAGGVHVEIQAE